ncbi:MAG: hypothetical protein NVS1B4_16760 [Gemmatimonadaceae bacterium]
MRRELRQTTPQTNRSGGSLPSGGGAPAQGVFWHQLGPSWAIPPGEGRIYHVQGRQIAIFRTRSGDLFATQPRCPHKHGPLVDGIVGGSVVMCPLHSFKFDLATGLPVGNACVALTTYPVTLASTGDILVCLSAHAPSDGGPDPS